MTASGKQKNLKWQIQKTAVEIEWIFDVSVREDIYEYIVNLGDEEELMKTVE